MRGFSPPATNRRKQARPITGRVRDDLNMAVSPKQRICSPNVDERRRRTGPAETARRLVSALAVESADRMTPRIKCISEKLTVARTNHRNPSGRTKVQRASAATTHPTAWRNPASYADVLQTSAALGAATVQLGPQAVASIGVLNRHSTTQRPGGLCQP